MLNSVLKIKLGQKVGQIAGILSLRNRNKLTYFVLTLRGQDSGFVPGIGTLTSSVYTDQPIDNSRQLVSAIDSF